MRKFASSWPEFVPQAGGQIPWGHILWVARRSDAVVDLTLKTMGAPLAVSTYDAGALPAEVRELLPSEEDLAHTFAEILAEEH